MHLTHRAGTHQDFEAFWASRFSRHQNNHALRAILAWEWHVFLNAPTTLTMLVEDTNRPASPAEDSVLPPGVAPPLPLQTGPPHLIVGCAQLVFVSEAFVTQACSGKELWINAQATHPLWDGSDALLTPAQVAAANAGEGLSALLTRWTVTQDRLTPSEAEEVRGCLVFEFLNFTRGYNYKEILVEAIGEDAQRGAAQSGFQCRVDYAALLQEHLLPGDCPMVFGINAAEAKATSSLLSYHFGVPRPRFGFRPREQALLTAALQQVSDKQFAASCDPPVTAARVKQHWREIFGRVAVVAPDVLPRRGADDQEGVRTLEKRAPVLHYLRSHPEELRPYLPAKPRTRRRPRKATDSSHLS